MKTKNTLQKLDLESTEGLLKQVQWNERQQKQQVEVHNCISSRGGRLAGNGIVLNLEVTEAKMSKETWDEKTCFLL